MVDTTSAVQSKVDINKIATDLNNKADRDLVNCPEGGVSSYLMPDYTKGENRPQGTYTEKVDGVLIIDTTNGGYGIVNVYIDGVDFRTYDGVNKVDYPVVTQCTFLIPKNTEYRIEVSINGRARWFPFRG